MNTGRNGRIGVVRLIRFVAAHAHGMDKQCRVRPDVVFSAVATRALALLGERLLPANIIADEAIRATFAAKSSNRIEFHSEFLDVSRFPGETQQQREMDFLREKYRERPPDLVIAGGEPALQFLLKYRSELFADVPIVHCAVDAEDLPKELPDAKIAGIAMLRPAASTLELALALQPDTRNVAVVAGSTPRTWNQPSNFGATLTSVADRVSFSWLTNLSLPDLCAEPSRLPDHTLVLSLTMFEDAAGAFFTQENGGCPAAPPSRTRRHRSGVPTPKLASECPPRLPDGPRRRRLRPRRA